MVAGFRASGWRYAECQDRALARAEQYGAGTIWSHVFAAVCRPNVRRVASTTICSAPSFRSLIVLEPGAASASRAGETERATRGRPAPAPSAEGEDASTSAVKPASARAGLTGRRR